MGVVEAILTVAIALVIAAFAVHFAVIEIGREVVTLRTASRDGTWKKTRLWVVDYEGDPWLHSAGKKWEARFASKTRVELVRGGSTGEYTATPDRSKHAEIDAALRKKYGLADRWVRFLAPCNDSVLPVRLERTGVQHEAE